MIDVILAFLFGYYLKKSEKTQKQIPSKFAGSIEYDKKNYVYVREGESVEDLT